jgi:uncharacterized membrane protein (UPF0182 family)
VLAVLAAAVLAARFGAHLETDWLWFREVGQERVYWTLLGRRWLAATVAGLATTALLLANLWIAERAAPPGARLVDGVRARRRGRRAMLAAQLGVAASAGILVAQRVATTDWQHYALWLHRRDLGVADPLFHRDVGYFLFSLPLYRDAAHWLLLTAALALVGAIGAHAATGAIRAQPPPLSGRRAARAHVLALGAILLAVLAWRHRLEEYGLALPGRSGTVPGAGYTDVHVDLPWMRALVFVTLGGAAMLAVAAVRRSSALPAVVLVMVVVAELVNPAVLPTVVQRLVVDPQTLSRERPYLADALAMTRRAYGLDRVTTRPVPANATISADELHRNGDTLRNVQLWDTDVLRPEIGQQQAIGSYYAFPEVTVDRYPRGGATRGVLLAERELDVDRLAPSGRTWANDRLAYTHGYGVVAVPAGDAGVDPEGKPSFLTAEFGRGRPPTELREPRLYYGVQPRRAQPWVVVDTNRAEIERPLAGSVPEPRYHYDGPGGIAMNGLLRRGLFALRYGDPNLVLSQTLGRHPRIVLHRDVNDRLHTLAPFLRWDRHPQAAVVDGRVLFLTYGYTTSATFPYAAPVRVDGRAANYVRAPVLATVDAFSGRVVMYTVDPGDPLIRAWGSVFPTLFTPGAEMPASIRAHLRYPRRLFAVQSRVWATYHMSDVDDFYTRADAWKRPADVSGPVQRVGGLRTRATRRGGRGPRLAPGFVLARLPGDRHPRFMFTTMYTPYSEENLSGYLTGSLDGRGRPQLTQLSLPRSRRVLGPAQVSRQILTSPGVSGALRLLNQETTDLGDRSVNIVEIGEPRVLPVGDSFLYVQALYVTARGTGVTRLRLVTVFLNGRVGYGTTLREALAKARASAGRASPSAPKGADERRKRPSPRGKKVGRQGHVDHGQRGAQHGARQRDLGREQR